jgi:predicted transposase YdaD
MLFVDWNWDDALAVRYGEGLEDGLEKGREERRRQQWETARNALAEGLSPDLVRKITGLSPQEIAAL